jgi:hypothetical protein
MDRRQFLGTSLGVLAVAAMPHSEIGVERLAAGTGSGFVTHIGYTPGVGAGEVSASTDLTGWQTAYQRTGPGAPNSTGAPYAMSVKDFKTNGYPNLPSTWGGSSAVFAANNGGVGIVPLIVFNNVPTTAQIQAYLASLPAGQKLALVFQSEQEAGISSSAFLSGWATISANLNAALNNLGGGFYNRANFPMVTSSRMDFYAANPGNTSFLPPPSQVDSYGLDIYHRNVFGGSGASPCGTAQSSPLPKDRRFQGWIQAVHKVAGANVSLSFPEYGISFCKNSYSAANEAFRAQLLTADWNYMTGSNRPGGNVQMMFWNYWYQMKPLYHFPFPLADGTETVAQASATIQQWQTMISNAG